MNGRGGFSLTELVSVIAVLSVLSVVSYLPLTGWRAAAGVRSEVMTLRANIMRAKLEAITNNHEVVIQLRSDGYLIYVDDGSGGGIKGDREHQANEKKLASHRLEHDVLLSDNFPNDRFRFRGRLGNKSGTITLENSDGVQIKLVLNTTGRIRTEKG